MTTPQQLTVEEASRLAVTATAADLEDWARGTAVHGRIDLCELIAVLDVLRAHSTPQQSEPDLPALTAC